MEPQPPPPPGRPHSWIWFFVALVVLTITAMGTLYLYNVGHQLTPAELEAAEKRWQEKGPRDYQLVYSTLGTGNAEPQRYVVRVKNGMTESLTVNGRVPPPEDAERLYPRYGMTALFHDIQEFLASDSKPGQPRTFARALFDAEDGHLLWYVRRVMGGNQRLEIRVEELKRLP